MPRRPSLKLFLAFGSGLALPFVGSCANGPQVRVHISDPAANGMEFFDQRTGEGGFVPYAQTDKFVCFTPSDTQVLLDFCGVGGHQDAKISGLTQPMSGGGL